MGTMSRRLPRHRSLAAAAALVLATGLTACGDEEPTAQDPGGAETSSAAGDSSEEPTGEPTDDGSDDGGEPATVTVPIYFAGETPQGLRLYREFRRVEADNPMEEAVALMVAGDALDPDYTTLWTEGSFESIGFSEGAGAIVAQVAGDDWADVPGDMTGEQATLALQQLVYTVQGIQGERLPVLVQKGADAATIYGVDTSGGLKAAKPLDVLAFMNVTTPEEGSTVKDTFTATGVGSSFEATVLWEVRDGSGTAVLEGFATAEGWIEKLYPWETEVDVSSLAPGTYSFVAFTDDPSGGEGAGPTEDSKTITVT
jgi:hypothetical protein